MYISIKKSALSIHFWILMLSSLSATNIFEDTLNFQQRIFEVFENNKHSVVQVIASYEDAEIGSEDDQPTKLIGSGFFISQYGHIVTNATITHALAPKKSSNLFIRFEDKLYEAESLGYDAATNVSIICTKDLPENASFVNLNDFHHQPLTGTLLLSASCKIGMEVSPTLGMLSGYNRSYGEEIILPTACIRSNIPADGGDAGAPVFDLNGRFIGLIIASLPEIHSSFLLPTIALQRIKEDILFSGKVNYAFIGIEVDSTYTKKLNYPVRVGIVVPDSPAAAAGILHNDIIVKMGDTPIESLPDLRHASFFAQPGKYVTLTIKRGSTLLQIPIKPSLAQNLEKIKESITPQTNVTNPKTKP